MGPSTQLGVGPSALHQLSMPTQQRGGRHHNALAQRRRAMTRLNAVSTIRSRVRNHGWETWRQHFEPPCANTKNSTSLDRSRRLRTTSNSTSQPKTSYARPTVRACPPRPSNRAWPSNREPAAHRPETEFRAPTRLSLRSASARCGERMVDPARRNSLSSALVSLRRAAYRRH